MDISDNDGEAESSPRFRLEKFANWCIYLA